MNRELISLGIMLIVLGFTSALLWSDTATGFTMMVIGSICVGAFFNEGRK